MNKCMSAQKLENFKLSVEDFSSNYNILLPVLNKFNFDIEEYCLDGKYMVIDARAMKNLCHHCSVT